MTQKQVLTASPIQGEAVVLNEEIAKSLAKMLSSKDEADHKMAQLILNTCDIEKSIYWIWKLSKGACNQMVNLRTKASRNFRNHSRLFYIYQKSERFFAEHLNSQGWLTPEIYQYLEQDIIQRTVNQCSNTFYDVDIKIKDEYKHLTGNPDFIIISKKWKDETN
jgi:hypothetical protein